MPFSNITKRAKKKIAYNNLRITIFGSSYHILPFYHTLILIDCINISRDFRLLFYFPNELWIYFTIFFAYSTEKKTTDNVNRIFFDCCCCVVDDFKTERYTYKPSIFSYIKVKCKETFFLIWLLLDKFLDWFCLKQFAKMLVNYFFFRLAELIEFWWKFLYTRLWWMWQEWHWASDR